MKTQIISDENCCHRGIQHLIGDLNQYHPPEKLPNGDIILRRKTQDDTAGDADGDGEVEL